MRRLSHIISTKYSTIFQPSSTAIAALIYIFLFCFVQIHNSNQLSFGSRFQLGFIVGFIVGFLIDPIIFGDHLYSESPTGMHIFHLIGFYQFQYHTFVLNCKYIHITQYTYLHLYSLNIKYFLVLVK